MATRRKYVTQAGVDAPIEPAMPWRGQAAPPAAPMPSPGGDAGNPLQRAPWRLQRQRQQQPQSVEEYIDRLPDLSDHKRSLLKQFPAFLSVIQAWIEVGKSMQ